jgi:heme/copper-type cytochrome/quinol oxidase subunit 2
MLRSKDICTDPRVVTRIYIGRFTMHFMNEKTPMPSLLRLAAAVFLGLIVGFILFLVAALFIGMFNQLMNMQIPIGMDVAENIISAILLVIFVVGSVGWFCWKVWTTPATEEEDETSTPEE